MANSDPAPQHISESDDLALEIISCLDPDAVEDFKSWRRERAKNSGCLVDGVEHKHFPAYLM